MTNIVINGQGFEAATAWTVDKVEVQFSIAPGESPSVDTVEAFDPDGPNAGDSTAGVTINSWTNTSIDFDFTPADNYVAAVTAYDVTGAESAPFDVDPDQLARTIEVTDVSVLGPAVHVQLDHAHPAQTMVVTLAGDDYELEYVPATDPPDPLPEDRFTDFLALDYYITFSAHMSDVATGDITDIYIYDGSPLGPGFAEWHGSVAWTGRTIDVTYDDGTDYLIIQLSVPYSTLLPTEAEFTLSSGPPITLSVPDDFEVSPDGGTYSVENASSVFGDGVELVAVEFDNNPVSGSMWSGSVEIGEAVESFSANYDGLYGVLRLEADPGFLDSEDGFNGLWDYVFVVDGVDFVNPAQLVIEDDENVRVMAPGSIDGAPHHLPPGELTSVTLLDQGTNDVRATTGPLSITITDRCYVDEAYDVGGGELQIKGRNFLTNEEGSPAIQVLIDFEAPAGSVDYYLPGSPSYPSGNPPTSSVSVLDDTITIFDPDSLSGQSIVGIIVSGNSWDNPPPGYEPDPPIEMS